MVTDMTDEFFAAPTKAAKYQPANRKQTNACWFRDGTNEPMSQEIVGSRYVLRTGIGCAKTSWSTK
jgi:hypothetical protein